MTGARAVKLVPIGLRFRVRRAAWNVAWLLLFRPSPRVLHGWRRLLLRLFGANIAAGARVYPSARVYAPWNLSMGPVSSLGDGVDCYNVEPVSLGAYAIVSQRAFLCTASHDMDDPDMPLTGAPITIETRAWVTSEVFVAPGVHLGEGAVALARAVVTRDVPAWTVVGGNPAQIMRKRQVQHAMPAYAKGHGNAMSMSTSMSTEAP